MKVAKLRSQGWTAIQGDVLTNGLSDRIVLSVGGAISVNEGHHDELEIVDLLWRNDNDKECGFLGVIDHSLDGWRPYFGPLSNADKPAIAIDENPVFTQAMANNDELPPVGSLYLDDSSQVCKCIGYVFEKELVVGEMVEHVPIDGNIPLSICMGGMVKVIDTRTEKQKAVAAAIDAVQEKGFIANDLLAAAEAFGIAFDAGLLHLQSNE